MDAINAENGEPAVLEAIDEKARLRMHRFGSARALETREHGRAVFRTEAKGCVGGEQVLRVRGELRLGAFGEAAQRKAT
jgi:hypothetical protein